MLVDPSNFDPSADGLLEDILDDVEKPTLDNYETYFDRMSLDTIRVYLASRGRVKSRPTSVVIGLLHKAEDRFRKTIALISWAADISESTAETHA